MGQGPGDSKERREDQGDRRNRGERGFGRPDRGGDRSGEGGERPGRGGESRGGDSQGEAPRTFGGRPSSTDASGKPGSKPVVRTGAARTSQKKTAASLTLPAEYLAKDANRDGQIGMYEWSQNDLSAFKKLDVNGDGFVVPSEFAHPGTRVASTSTIAPTVSGSAAPTSGPPTFKLASTPSTFRASSRTPSSSGTESQTAAKSSDPLVAQAEDAFALRDINKDGQLDQDEFDGSVRIKRVFEKAKLTFSAPMARDKFLATYREALLAKDAKTAE